MCHIADIYTASLCTIFKGRGWGVRGKTNNPLTETFQVIFYTSTMYYFHLLSNTQIIRFLQHRVLEVTYMPFKKQSFL